MGPFKNFAVELGLQVDDKYKVEPEGHNKARWASSNGSDPLYTSLDDMHLINVFLMLKRSISYHENVVTHRIEYENSIAQIEFMRKQFHHASYEIYKRGLFVTKQKDYTTCQS